MNDDPTLKDWLNSALAMTLSRKRTKTVAAICDTYDYMPMLKRIKVSRDKEERFNTTTKFEEAVREVLAGVNDSLAAERYGLDLETLRNEIFRLRDSPVAVYEYNASGRIFTYKEELMLLEVLATVPHSRCMCQTCTLERLPFLAYHAARQKGKPYPREWDQQQRAGRGWLTNFKIEYEYEIANSFPHECEIRDQVQASVA